MKIIVVSDTHGSKDALRRIMELNSGADAVVHCGDSRGEMEEIKMRYPGKQYYEVRGNCDIGSALPQTLTFELDGFRYMVTHGHAYNVKYGLDRLFYAAKEAGVDAVFFGHTHRAGRNRRGNPPDQPRRVRRYQRELCRYRNEKRSNAHQYRASLPRQKITVDFCRRLCYNRI